MREPREPLEYDRFGNRLFQQRLSDQNGRHLPANKKEFTEGDPGDECQNNKPQKRKHDDECTNTHPLQSKL